MDLQALWLTLRLASATTALLLGCALPLAWWIARGSGALRALVQALVALPLVLPPTVLGFFLLTGFSPQTALGRTVSHLLGHSLAFSFAGLLAGSMLYSLPFAVQPLVAGFRALDPGLLEAAAMLGTPPWKIVRTLALPLSTSALIMAGVLTFTHTIGEFGVVLMLGGNIPGMTRTLSIMIFDLVEDGRYAEAQQVALLLAGVATLALVVIYLRPAVFWNDAAQRSTDSR